jgi:hypothetical protein
MSLIEKIDVEIDKHYLIINDTKNYASTTREYYETRVEALKDFKEILLSEQKEPCTGCKHEKDHVSTYPCNMCPRAYTDKYDPINQPYTES